MNRIASVLAGCLLMAGCASTVPNEYSEALRAKAGDFSITVYPVHVIGGEEETEGDAPFRQESDAGLAQTIVDTLKARGIATVVPSVSDVAVPFEFVMGQHKMWKESAKKFGEQIALTGIDTEYALLVEVLIPPGRDQVYGVHIYVVNDKGIPCEGGLTNSHWDIFTQVVPTDRNDGIEIALAMLHCLDPIVDSLDLMYRP